MYIAALFLFLTFFLKKKPAKIGIVVTFFNVDKRTLPLSTSYNITSYISERGNSKTVGKSFFLSKFFR